MPVTIDYQTWDSSSFNWLDKTTTTGAPLQITEKLDAWIAAVNSNASNANKQIIRRKGPADSTSANFIGWAIECTSNAASSGFFARLYTNTSTNFAVVFSAAWLNDGTNGGYGAGSGNSISDSTVAWASSAVIGEFSVATSTDNGQEFFCLGWRLGNDTAKSDQFLIFKGVNGEWCSLFSDGGAMIGTYYMDAHSAPQRNYNVGLTTMALNTSASFLSRLIVTSSNSTQVPTTSVEYTGAMLAANSAIYYSNTATEWGYGRWSNMVDGRKIVCMGYGPIWIAY